MYPVKAPAPTTGTTRGTPRPIPTPVLLAASALLALAFLAVVIDRTGPARLARIPAWEGTLAVPPALEALGVLASPAALAVVAWALLFRAWWRRDLTGVYALLAAGPGTFMVVAGLNLLLAHLFTPTSDPPWPFVGTFPDPAAAVAVALAAVCTVDARGRVRRRGAVVATAGMVLLLRVASGSPLDAVVAGSTLGGAVGLPAAVARHTARRIADPAPGDAPAERVRRWLLGLWGWADRHLWGNQALLLCAIALGVALRIAASSGPLGPDATRYAALGHSFSQTGSLVMPWGNVYSPGEPAFSHHYPPLYPMMLAGAYRLWGFSEGVTHAVGVATSLAAVAVTYLCGRDLYGHSKALVATAVVALAPPFILTAGNGYSEGAVTAFFVLAVWCALRSVHQPWFMVPAGIIAGLGYLTRSSLGHFFIIAGLGGLLWRVRWKGWRVLLRPSYLLGIALFGTIVAAWAARNLRLFGSWETSPHISGAIAFAFAHPLASLSLLPFSLVFMGVLATLLYLGALPWLPALRRVDFLRDEHDSGLLVALLIPLVLAVLTTTSLWGFERVFYVHNVRYASIAVVPLAWMLVRHAPRAPSTMLAGAAMAAILVAGSVHYATPDHPIEDRMSDRLGAVVADGDRVAFVDTHDVYRYYIDATGNGERRVPIEVARGEEAAGLAAEWAVVHGEGEHMPPGYELVGTERGWSRTARDDTFTLWRRS